MKIGFEFEWPGERERKEAAFNVKRETNLELELANGPHGEPCLRLLQDFANLRDAFEALHKTQGEGCLPDVGKARQRPTYIWRGELVMTLPDFILKEAGEHGGECLDLNNDDPFGSAGWEPLDDRRRGFA